jgi:hypothetical protein
VRSSPQYTLAEESALWWALRIVNRSSKNTLSKILEYECKVEKEEREARVGPK